MRSKIIPQVLAMCAFQFHLDDFFLEFSPDKIRLFPYFLFLKEFIKIMHYV